MCDVCYLTTFFQTSAVLVASKDNGGVVGLSEFKQYTHYVIDDKTSLSGAQIDMMVLTGLMASVSS